MGRGTLSQVVASEMRSCGIVLLSRTASTVLRGGSCRRAFRAAKRLARYYEICAVTNSQRRWSQSPAYIVYKLRAVHMQCQCVVCSDVLGKHAGHYNRLTECNLDSNNLVGNLPGVDDIGIIIELYPDPADPLAVNLQLF